MMLIILCEVWEFREDALGAVEDARIRSKRSIELFFIFIFNNSECLWSFYLIVLFFEVVS